MTTIWSKSKGVKKIKRKYHAFESTLSLCGRYEKSRLQYTFYHLDKPYICKVCKKIYEQNQKAKWLGKT